MSEMSTRERIAFEAQLLREAVGGSAPVKKATQAAQTFQKGASEVRQQVREDQAGYKGERAPRIRGGEGVGDDLGMPYSGMRARSRTPDFRGGHINFSDPFRRKK